MSRKTLIILAVLVVGGLILYSALKGNFNTLVEKEESALSQLSEIQNQLQRRADLIPNLVNTAKGYANFEQETLAGIANARASVGQLTVDEGVLRDPELLEKFTEVQTGLSGALSRLMMVTENYPELRASAQFQTLMTQLEGTENRIAVARRRYNETARDYNTTARKFPTNIFAGLFGFDRMVYFQGAEGVEQAPEVNFD